MTVASVTLSLLKTLPSPLYKNRTGPIPVKAITKNAAGSNIAVTRVEFTLLRSVINEPGLGTSPKTLVVTSNNGTTGEYEAVFPESDFTIPGQYVVQARANVIDGGTGLITHSSFAQFEVANVVELNGPDGLFDLNEDQIERIKNPAFPVWRKVTLTGADIKRLVDETGTSANIDIDTLPAGAMLVGGALNVNTADTGSASTATITLGANSTAFNEILAATTIRSTGETGANASFVPNLAGGTALRSVVAVTGAGITLANLSDNLSLDLFYGYVMPQTKVL